MNSMWEMLAGLGDQYRWAAELDPPSMPRAESVLVCGMGGSAISGNLAAAAVPAARLSVHKGYGLPGWAAGARPLVIAVSYSGNTEETRSAVDEALPSVCRWQCWWGVASWPIWPMSAISQSCACPPGFNHVQRWAT